jgi:hypothetical protein
VKGLTWFYQESIIYDFLPWRWSIPCTWNRIIKNIFLDWVGVGFSMFQDHSCQEYIKDIQLNLTNS